MMKGDTRSLDIPKCVLVLRGRSLAVRDALAAASGARA